MENTEEKKNNLRLTREMLGVHLRYERMTSAVLQSALFLRTAEQVASENEDMKRALEDFAKYLEPHGMEYESFFAGMYLANVVSEVEMYLVEVMKQLLIHFPKKNGSTNFRLSDVLDKTPDELVLIAAEERLNKLMFKRPAEYLEDLGEILSVDLQGVKPFWTEFIEAKARRDLGVHNGWRINDTYRRKTAEVGIVLPDDVGPLMQPDFKYLLNVIPSCDSMVRDIATLLQAKYSPKDD